MFEQISTWAASNGSLLAWLTGISVVMFVGTLLLLPIAVARIPEDYFTGGHRHVVNTRQQHPVIYWGGVVLKNLLGVALIVVGIAMLLLPGQGILAILIGISLTNFPGKYRLERWLVGLPKVLDAINWLRAKSKQPPLQAPA